MYWYKAGAATGEIFQYLAGATRRLDCHVQDVEMFLRRFNSWALSWFEILLPPDGRLRKAL